MTVKNGKTDIKDLRQFGMVLGLVLAIFAFLQFRKDRETVYMTLSVLSAVVVSAGILAPRVLTHVLKVFMFMAHILGWINTRIILVLVYYFILTPIALTMKVLRKDLLDRKISPQGETYWHKRSVTAISKESLEKQF